jgi:hypothetical protein
VLSTLPVSICSVPRRGVEKELGMLVGFGEAEIEDGVGQLKLLDLQPNRRRDRKR